MHLYLYPFRGSGELCDLPQRGSAQSPGANIFLYNFWPIDDHWRLRLSPLISCVYGKIWGQLALASQSQIWGRVRRPLVLLQNTNTTTHSYFIVYGNEIVGVEQSFTVFLRKKATSRPFKLTSEMEVFYAITLSTFPGEGKCPPCPCLWALWIHMIRIWSFQKQELVKWRKTPRNSSSQPKVEMQRWFVSVHSCSEIICFCLCRRKIHLYYFTVSPFSAARCARRHAGCDWFYDFRCSTVFLSRDSIITRDIDYIEILSVCPSVTLRYCVETAVHIIRLFSYHTNQN